MTNQEFSNEFDILYNNIASNQAPGLDEYEKSVFLTNAQDSLVLELITGKNLSGESFEKTEELREYLTDLVKTARLSPIEDRRILKISDKSTMYTPPQDLWFIVYESVTLDEKELDCNNFNAIKVIPITHDEYSKIRNNPFRRPERNRVLRLNISNKIELISKYKINDYTIRYISKLEPIILTNISEDGLSIKGEDKETECKLNPALHEAILGRAVELAKASMGLIESGR